MAELTYKPYKIPAENIAKAIEPYIPPKQWEPKVGELATLVLPVKVFRDFGNGMVDIHDDESTCLKVSKKSLTNYLFTNSNTDYIMKAMKDAVLTVAKQLAKANNTVTTLEIKTELRRDYPYYYWTQQAVSDFMAQLAGDGIFTFTDNGIYRIYSLATPAHVAVTAGPVSATVTTSTSGGTLSGISKVAGTVASKPVAVASKRGRPRKTNVINRSTAYTLAGNAGFESAVINGALITRAAIRAQKKSPLGYLTNTKLNKLSEITVSGKTYQVK